MFQSQFHGSFLLFVVFGYFFMERDGKYVFGVRYAVLAIKSPTKYYVFQPSRSKTVEDTFLAAKS